MPIHPLFQLLLIFYLFNVSHMLDVNGPSNSQMHNGLYDKHVVDLQVQKYRRGYTVVVSGFIFLSYKLIYFRQHVLFWESIWKQRSNTFHKVALNPALMQSPDFELFCTV